MVPPNEDASRRSPFTFDVPADLRALREAIRAGGLTDEGFSQALAVDATEKLMDLAAALRRTAAPSPLHTLLRLFVLGRRVTEGEVRAALRPLEIAPFAALGLLHRDGGDVWAEASLIPHEDLLLARDFWPDFTELPMPPDYVLGVGAASQTSASLTVRRPVQAALDLGTGCGYLAILAARHAERVVATDISARALAFAHVIIPAPALAELPHQFLLQPLDRIVQTRADGPHTALAYLGDLLQRHVLEKPEQDNRSVRFRQLGDSPTDRQGPHLALDYLGRRAPHILIRSPVRDDVEVGPIRLEDLAPTLDLPKRVPTRIRRDREYPRREVGTLVEGVEPTDDLGEYVLRQILRHVASADEPRSEVEHRPVVALDQGLHGRAVTLPASSHELDKRTA